MDIEGIRGDTEYYDMAMIRGDAAVPLSGANVKIWFTIKREDEDLDADALIALNSVANPTQVVITDEAAGLFYVRLDPTDTEDITDEHLLYDVQVREQDNRFTTVRKGKFKLIRDITRSVA